MQALALFRMGPVRTAHECCGKKVPSGHTYPTMIKRDTVIHYLKKIRKVYQSATFFFKKKKTIFERAATREHIIEFT